MSEKSKLHEPEFYLSELNNLDIKLETHKKYELICYVLSLISVLSAFSWFLFLGWALITDLNYSLSFIIFAILTLSLNILILLIRKYILAQNRSRMTVILTAVDYLRAIQTCFLLDKCTYKLMGARFWRYPAT